MHKELPRGNGLQKMIVIGADNSVYLNGAIVPRDGDIVPRVKRSADEQTTDNQNFMNNESSHSTPSTERHRLQKLGFPLLESRPN